MNRRKFLVGTAAAGAGAIAGLGNLGAQGQPPAGQAPAGQPAAGQPAAGRGRGGGGRGGPANVAPEKLARIAHDDAEPRAIMKLPWATNPSPSQTIALMDLPQYYVDTYGVRDVEFQHSHLRQGTSDPDPAFFKEMKAKLDAAGSEGQPDQHRDRHDGADGRRKARSGRPGGGGACDVAGAREEMGATWRLILGIKRLMLNQGALNDDSKAGVISLWKELQDYAKPKKIMISAETRGSGPPAQPGRCAAVVPAE